MKKTITILFILISGFAYSQKTTKDSLWTPKSDTTEFISPLDINTYLKEMGRKISYDDMMTIRTAFQTVVNKAIDRKRKKKP